MTTLLIVIAVVFLLGLGGGAAMLFLFRGSQAAGHQATAAPERPPEQEQATAGAPPAESIPGFRWRFILLPALVLLVSILLTSYFYRLLPAEVGYRFQADGAPGSVMSRENAILWAILPQALLTLLALSLTWGITRLGPLYQYTALAGVRLDRVVLVMGNMIALPQIILVFAMADVFSYNSYQLHLLPVWAIGLIVVTLGAVVLGAFFVRTLRRAAGSAQNQTDPPEE